MRRADADSEPAALTAPVPTRVGPYTVLVAPKGWSETAAPSAPFVTVHPRPAVSGICPEIRRAPSGLVVPEDWQAAYDLVVRAVGVLHGDVCLYASVESGPCGSCRLALAAHTQRCAQRLVVLRGTSVFTSSHWHGLAGITSDGRDIMDFSPRERVNRLATAAASNFPCATAHARHAARLDPRLTAYGTRVNREALPAIVTSVPFKVRHTDDVGIGTASDSLRDLQHQALHLYGRLEPERALSWFLEELGELAQAMRRRESSARIEEELGQVTAWCLCMANIGRVDLVRSLSRAMHEEYDRQFRKYGALQPYISQEES